MKSHSKGWGRCRHCGQKKIRWVKTFSGGTMPINGKPSADGDIWVRQFGELAIGVTVTEQGKIKALADDPDARFFTRHLCEKEAR